MRQEQLPAQPVYFIRRRLSSYFRHRLAKPLRQIRVAVRPVQDSIEQHGRVRRSPQAFDERRGLDFGEIAQLDPLPDTASDSNDPFVVVALELPR